MVSLSVILLQLKLEKLKYLSGPNQRITWP